MVNVIPGPFRVATGSGDLPLCSGTRFEYAHVPLMPIVERFCRDISQRTGLRFVATRPEAGTGMDDVPSIRIEVTDDSDLGSLPATIGVSPVTDAIPDER